MSGEINIQSIQQWQEMGDYMKKLLIFVSIFIFTLCVTSCSNKSGTADILGIAEISELITEKGYTEEDFQEELSGQHRDNIIHVWGEPDGMLSGFWGDIWHLSDENNQKIILYYDKDGVVENVRIAEKQI